MIVLSSLILVAVVGGLVYAIGVAVRNQEQSRTTSLAGSGWVYFVGTNRPDDPIKVGCTTRDPRRDRLPELDTMSPHPLSVIYCFKASNARAMEAAVHHELKPWRHHGEWFERDPTLAYIDGLVRF